MASLFSIEASVEGIEPIVERLSQPLDGIVALQQTVSKWGRKAQVQATRNVSNTAVTYEGKTFVIKRVTGKLARSIQLTSVTPLSATIVAQAEYAAAVHEGHGPIDMKPHLLGKTVPIMVDKSGPISGFGKDMTSVVAKAMGAKRVQKKASTGRVVGSNYIVFRRVGPNSHGWIIPAAPGRPYMSAAGAAVQDGFSHDVQKAIVKAYGGD